MGAVRPSTASPTPEMENAAEAVSESGSISLRAYIET